MQKGTNHTKNIWGLVQFASFFPVLAALAWARPRSRTRRDVRVHNLLLAADVVEGVEAGINSYVAKFLLYA